MPEGDILNAIAQLGGLVVLAGALLTGAVITKSAMDSILKERDRADVVREARLEDLKVINKDLTVAVRDSSEALRRLADAWEARNRAEASKG